MEVKNGLLWTKDEDIDLLPLFSSTVKVLGVLQHELPVFENNGNRSGDERSHQTTEVDEESLSKLERVNGLVELLHVALTDLENLRQRNYDKPKKERKKHNASQQKQDALLKQRERLSKMLNNDGEADEDDEDAGDGEDDLQNSDPYLRLVRFWNSLALLTPILAEIFCHMERNNAELTVMETQLNQAKKDDNGKERTGKDQSWILGVNVWDVCTRRFFNSTWKQLCSLWEAAGATSKISDAGLIAVRKMLHEDGALTCLATSSMQGLVDMKINKQQSFRLDDSFPLDNRTIPDRVALETALVRWDNGCGLLQEFDAEVHSKYMKSIDTLYSKLNQYLGKRFQNQCRLSIYGSCLSELSLGKGSDVDISINLKQAKQLREDFLSGQIGVNKYEKTMKQLVYQVCRAVEYRTDEFTNLQPVTRARVPVVKGRYQLAKNPYSADGSIDFDICFLNDIAVRNSTLLREYSLVDPRVKQVMIAIKRWSKANDISTSQRDTISSYAWMNLVVFYLQCIGFVPNLQSDSLASEVGLARDTRDEWHNVNNLNTFFLKWSDVEEMWTRKSNLDGISVTSLLYGFFRFYAVDFPWHTTMISIFRGAEECLPKTLFHKASMFFCIEDPFETYDSHCPHDLGTPATAKGAMRIIHCFRDAEAFLGGLLAKVALDATIDPPEALWPTPDGESDGPKSNNKNKSDKRGGRGNKKNRKGVEKAAGKQDAASKVDQKKKNGNPSKPKPSNGKVENKDALKLNADTTVRNTKNSAKNGNQKRAPAKTVGPVMNSAHESTPREAAQDNGASAPQTTNKKSKKNAGYWKAKRASDKERKLQQKQQQPSQPKDE